jgi:hypothetical protein
VVPAAFTVECFQDGLERQSFQTAQQLIDTFIALMIRQIKLIPSAGSIKGQPT